MRRISIRIEWQNHCYLSGMENVMFKLPDQRESRGTSFAASLAVHAVLLFAGLVLPLLWISAPVVRQYFVMPLIAPPVAPQVVKLAPRPVVVRPKPVLKPIKVKPVKVPPPSPMVSPPIRIVATLNVKPSPALDIKMPDMKIDEKPAPVLSELPRAEMPAPRMPAPLAAKTSAPKQVQTGGFGDPNGVSAVGSPGRVS